MTSSTVFSDVVLPAATWYEKHDLNTTDMHPFVHSFNPAIAPPWQTRTDFDAFHASPGRSAGWPPRTSACATTSSRSPLLHDTPDELANPRGVVRDWAAGECEPVPGRRPCRSSSSSSATTRRSRTSGPRSGPLVDRLGLQTKGVTIRPDRGGRLPAAQERRACAAAPADGRPALARDVHGCEAILALSGTTNGRLATQGFRFSEERTGTRLADLAAEHEGKQITFADTQARPTPVITSPEWSGSEHGGRRYSPFTINVERLKPWHTLTGRQHFFLDHDWMTEAGRGAAGLPAAAGHARAVRRAARRRDRRARHHRPLPDPAQQVVDPLGVPGQPVHAVAVPRRPDDLDEHAGRGEGRRPRQRLDRGGQPQRRRRRPGDRLHRMPEGTVYMYHAQDRLIDVPRSETSGKRGGIHNSLTRLLVKPTHLIGGLRAAVLRLQLPRARPATSATRSP